MKWFRKAAEQGEAKAKPDLRAAKHRNHGSRRIRRWIGAQRPDHAEPRGEGFRGRAPWLREPICAVVRGASSVLNVRAEVDEPGFDPER